ncbi:hypothetical protein JR316_0013184 [Psilocybe cubensis]|uniref:Uncharacterized protein n=2 Tax=Psilocybe cubensis TaxID=181762 RepID=A0A8H8CHM3_PSICU|nr:hypothetical protein JR316_0013184 [Psilocybe cubensis]KAH9474719.1 hypothetical protein JR316_0013184 [Psilocybe cubensis]
MIFSPLISTSWKREEDFMHMKMTYLLARIRIGILEVTRPGPGVADESTLNAIQRELEFITMNHGIASILGLAVPTPFFLQELLWTHGLAINAINCLFDDFSEEESRTMIKQFDPEGIFSWWTEGGQIPSFTDLDGLISSTMTKFQLAQLVQSGLLPHQGPFRHSKYAKVYLPPGLPIHRFLFEKGLANESTTGSDAADAEAKVANSNSSPTKSGEILGVASKTILKSCFANRRDITSNSAIADSADCTPGAIEPGIGDTDIDMGDLSVAERSPEMSATYPAGSAPGNLGQNSTDNDKQTSKTSVPAQEGTCQISKTMLFQLLADITRVESLTEAAMSRKLEALRRSIWYLGAYKRLNQHAVVSGKSPYFKAMNNSNPFDTQIEPEGKDNEEASSDIDDGIGRIITGQSSDSDSEIEDTAESSQSESDLTQSDSAGSQWSSDHSASPSSQEMEMTGDYEPPMEEDLGLPFSMHYSTLRGTRRL